MDKLASIFRIIFIDVTLFTLMRHQKMPNCPTKKKKKETKTELIQDRIHKVDPIINIQKQFLLWNNQFS